MNAVELAIKMETDAIAFYLKAAEKTSHLVGKKMFLAIIDDEKRHLDALSRIFKGLDLTFENVSPMRKIKTVFEQNKDAMLERVQATTDDLEALKIAMQMEKESVDFYEKAAKEASTKTERDLFESLVKEEIQHFTIFNNTYSFLTDSGNWYMWDEYSIVDGGTPWA
jgi:rubrerythrin